MSFQEDLMIRLVPPPGGSYGSTDCDLEGRTGDDNSGPTSSADRKSGFPKLNTFVDGKIRPIKDIEKNEWAFLGVCAIAILTSTGFTIYKLATVDKHHTDFIFGLVMLINEGFCSYYLVHGVLKQRSNEIIILVIATVIIVVYLGINYDRGLQATIKLVRLIIACCLAPVVVGLGVWLGLKYRQTGSLIFRISGSAKSWVHSMYSNLFCFLDLLKLDLQLGITVAVLTHVNDPDVSTGDIGVLCFGIVISIVWFALGHMCVRRENKIMTYVFWGLSPLELAYVIYKIVKASSHLALYPVLAPCSITAGCLAVVVRVTIMILSYLVYRNYGKGVKENAFGTQNS